MGNGSNITLYIAILASCTTIALAYINYKFGRRSVKKSKKTEVRTQSYIDFINCVSELAITKKRGLDRDTSIIKRLTDSKTRISIYGDKEVIRALAEFDKKYGTLDSEEAVDSFMSIILEMRNDSIGNRKYDISKELKQVIFGNIA